MKLVKYFVKCVLKLLAVSEVNVGLVNWNRVCA